MLARSCCPRLFLGLGVGIALMAHARSQQTPATPDVRAPEVPLVFVENKGQWPADVAFRAERGAFTAWLHDRGWTMSVRKDDGKTAHGVNLRLTFEESRAVRPVGTRRLVSSSSFFIGRDSDRWVTGAANFDQVRFRGLYEGVDVVVRSAGQHPEYDVVLAPNADLGQVVVRCEGVDDLEVTADGSLLMHSGSRSIRQTAPTTWYVRPDGGREIVECRFRRIGSQRYGFVVEKVIEGLPLVIDPGFVWSTFFGGDGPDDRTYSVKRGANGQVIAGGTTNSSDFPTTPGSFSSTPLGGRDAWVAVFDPTATGAMQLISSTRYGGSQDDWCYNIEFNQQTETLTLCGNSLSPDFPVTANAAQTVAGGNMDGYYLEIDLSKSGADQIRYATLIGGPGRDFVTAHKVRGNRVTMTGEASAGFPTTPGTFQPAHGGGNADAFVAVLDLSQPTQFLASTLLGGSGEDGNRLDFVDQGVDLDVDENGNAAIAGRTASADFPTTAGALQSAIAGTQDGFVARFSLDLSSLEYSTYVGGLGSDAFSQVHADGNGVVTAAGYAGGDGFPVSADALQPMFAGGNSDVVVVRIDTTQAGSAGLVYGTHLGGGATGPATSTERVRGMAVEASGAIVLGGFVGTTDFPTTPGAFSSTLGGPPVNGFVARIDPQQPAAAQLLYSSYVSGTGVVAGLGLDLDGEGGALIGGVTTASDFTVTPGAFGSTYSTVGLDGWVAQLDLLPAGVNRIGQATPGCGGTPYAGVTTQPRVQPTFGVFNNEAKPYVFGVMLLGSEAAQGFPFANATAYVDLFQPFTANLVQANGRGYAQVDLQSSQLAPGTVTAQFVWLNGFPCRGFGAVSASNALSF